MSKPFYGAVANFNKKYPNLSNALFGDISELEARDFIVKAGQLFQTPFFDMLREYLKQNNKGSGFVQAVMDMPLLDARSIHEELT